MRESIKEYFTFSKKERTGILVLVAIVIVIAMAPAFYSPHNLDFGDSTVIHEFKDQVASLDAADINRKSLDSAASTAGNRYQGFQKYRNDQQYESNGKYKDNFKKKYPDDVKRKNVVMFDFDPNTIAIQGWVQLGISERTATTIEKYRSKGGRFRKAEDILRIYGLSEDDKERLLPFVKIPPDDIGKQHNSSSPLFQTFKKPRPQIIDINIADTTGWSSLPGIGPVLSQRIIKYRDRLGGFYSIEQVAEVYGLQDSNFQKIRPFLSLVTGVKKINVNVATPDILEQHPYLKRQLARAIVDYRSQHGIFKEISELKQVVSITPELFNRISHYIGL